jgi:hypothetical protein
MEQDTILLDRHPQLGRRKYLATASTMSFSQALATASLAPSWSTVGIEDAVLLSAFAATFAFYGLWREPRAAKAWKSHLEELSKVPQSVLQRKIAPPTSPSRNICDVTKSSVSLCAHLSIIGVLLTD